MIEVKRHIGFGLLSVMLMLTGCRDSEADIIASRGYPVDVELAYAFSSANADGQTRQADEVVQNTTPRFPAANNLTVIGTSFNDKDNTHTMYPSETTLDNSIIDRTGDTPDARFYHSVYCSMPTGVNHCLVYGSVADATPTGGINNKMYNGSIQPSMELNLVKSQSSLNSLSFSLESIYPGTDAPTEANTVAEALTVVANTSGWKGSTNAVLNNLFINFTNHGEDLPGSAATAKKWLEALATAAQSYIDNPPATIGDAEKTILGNIKAAAGTKASAIGEITATSYPRNLNLPDGAAAVRWVESANAFQPAMQTTTLDNVNSMSRWAYPAALYYFVDSPIKTASTTVDIASLCRDGGITAESGKTVWETVMAKSEFDDNKVTVTTKTVAVEWPVEYAVAQLQVNVKASAASLPDATMPSPKSVAVTNPDDNNKPSFPLKGVIVCGQRPVDYLFRQASNSDVDVKFIYDSHVKECNLTTTDYTPACNTLVLQSGEKEDVEIILEFENNSNQDFLGVDGTVYSGTRFYLIGKVEALTGNAVTTDEHTKQVFTKDYITTVNMTVTSLAKAYNVLPNLLTKNLEIGVETTPQWVAATPTTIRLDDKE